MPVVVFVAPFFLSTTVRFVTSAAKLPDVQLVLVSQDPAHKLPPGLRARLAAHLRIDDALDADQIARAVSDVRRHAGEVHRVLGALEELQVPLAEVRERFEIPGMTVEAARSFRDKARMKSVLREAGLPCAAHRLVRRAEEAWAFVAEIGYPVVVKPPEGAGARNTFRIDGPDGLGDYLRAFPPDERAPTLIEEFVVGDEHSFDCVCVQGRPVWHSISRYHPSPLEVMQNQWIQWCVLLPRRIDGPEYAEIRAAGAHALGALGMWTGLSHMEWFRRRDGSVAISEVGARPPGAQFTTLISYAHDYDFYHAWAKLMIHDTFDPPRRDFACGVVFLRGQGAGRVKAIHGLARAQQEVGSLVIEAKLPVPGQPAASSYEGDGYVIVRHPETRVVEDVLGRILQLVRVELG
jgi:biotin carboxylase